MNSLNKILTDRQTDRQDNLNSYSCQNGVCV